MEDSGNWQVSEIYIPKKTSITDLELSDRPREKFMEKGASALSNAELLAILIGSGNKEENAVELMQHILKDCGGSLKRLSRMTIDELKQYKSIGDAKAITILAATELAKRRDIEDIDTSQYDTAKALYDLLLPRMKNLNEEEAYAILMNNQFKLLKLKQLSHGGLTETAVDVRIIIKEAILANATIVAIAHNHPSNNPHPSRDDDRLTKQVAEALKVMRIHFADHIIITDGDYYSYNENGKL